MAATGKPDQSTKKPVQCWSTRIPAPWHNTLIGAVVLLSLVSTCIAAPRLLPHVFLLFAATGLPWRVIEFSRRNYVCFLVDWCYFANLAVILFFLFEPQPSVSGQQAPLWQGLEAGVYVMAEGPLAAALVAWRCSWVLGWADYTTSVFIHLLPGLAMAAHRHAWVPPPPVKEPASNWLTTLVNTIRTGTSGSRHKVTGKVCSWSDQKLMSDAMGARRIVHEWHLAVKQLCTSVSHAADTIMAGLPDAGSSRLCVCPSWGDDAQSWLSRMRHADLCCWQGKALWVLGFPLMSYLLWQAAYWLIIQVICKPVIRTKRLDTSYKSLARRAKKSGGTRVSAFVLKGSTARRLTAFGLVQLVFTLCTMVVGILSYYSAYAALIWQVIKFALPLYAGVQDTIRAHKFAASLREEMSKEERPEIASDRS